MVTDRPERVIALWLPELDEDLMGNDGYRNRGDQHHHGDRDGRDDSDDRDDGARQDRERRWERILQAVEELIPGVEALRPGWCLIRARGPARYYGGESAAAEALISCVSKLGISRARVGVASGRFAAEQAALSLGGDAETRIIPPELTRSFLDPLPIERAAAADLSEVLLSLGIRTLGAFAALPTTAVLERFGPEGAMAWRRALGLSAPHAAEVRPREPPVDLGVEFACEPPLEGADQLAFACAAHAERLLSGLTSRGLVCTELRVVLTDDVGGRHDRDWAHPGGFSAADVVNRVRWQAEQHSPRAGAEHDARGGAGVAAVRIDPVRTARAADHEPGLWSTAPDERVHHQLSRVQSLLGHDGVGTGELVGGRSSTDRQRLVPWGSGSAAPARPRAGAWPGHVPGPSPSTVFPDPPPMVLLDRAGSPIRLVGTDSALGADPALGDDGDIADRGDLLLSNDPARLGFAHDLLPAGVIAWSAPWPLRERSWAEGTVTRYRVQVLLEDGDAWLLRYAHDRGWSAEARYA